MGLAFYKDKTNNNVLQGSYYKEIAQAQVSNIGGVMGYYKKGEIFYLPICTSWGQGVDGLTGVLRLQRNDYSSTYFNYLRTISETKGTISAYTSINTGKGTAYVTLSTPLVFSIQVITVSNFSNHTNYAHVFAFNAGTSGTQSAQVLSDGWWWESVTGMTLNAIQVYASSTVDISKRTKKAYYSNASTVSASNTSQTNTASSPIYIVRDTGSIKLPDIAKGTYTPSTFMDLIKTYISVNSSRTVKYAFSVKVNGQTVSVEAGGTIYFKNNSASGTTTLAGVSFGEDQALGNMFSSDTATSTGFTKYKTYICYCSSNGPEYFKNYTSYSITVNDDICFN
jgi:hypothetical protein